jgi:hypothetical protein
MVGTVPFEEEPSMVKSFPFQEQSPEGDMVSSVTGIALVRESKI